MRIWIRVYGVAHPVRVYALRNATYVVHRGSPEPRIAALILALLDTFSIRSFWDVGACIGYYSWLVHSAMPEAAVLAIEPDALNLDLLAQTRTRTSGVEIVPAAVSRADGTATFFPDPIAGATGTLETGPTFNERNYGASTSAGAVRTRTLDSLAAEYGMPRLVKIDVEEHEMAALEGGSRVLRAHPLILLETFKDPGGVLERLRDAGYHLLAADTLREGRLTDVNYLAVGPDDTVRLQELRYAHARRLADMGLA